MTFRRVSSSFVLFCIIAVLSPTFLTLSYAAPTNTKCTLTDVHNVIADWRSDNTVLLDTNEKLSKLLLNFEIIESRLVRSCDGLKDHLTKTERFLAVTEPASHIPNLNSLIKPVQKVGEHIKLLVLQTPHDTVCKTVLNIRRRIDDVATKFKKVQDSKIVEVVTAIDETSEQVEEVLALYENAGGNPTNCVQLDHLCAAARDARDFQRKLVEQMEELIKQASPLNTFLETVERSVSRIMSSVQAVFKGPTGKVFDEVNKLLGRTITLPIPRGAKERGVGVIPTCCPTGYSNSGGLCYQNCRSGYTPVLFTCVEKCKSGWKDIGVTCTRIETKKVGFIKIPVPQFDAKDSYARLGKIPSTFGNAACSCRRDKKYLEAGLCYDKCGRDHLSGYGTAFLTQCLDLRSTKLTIIDLAENLNIFKQAEKIPAIGSVIKQLNSLFDTVFSALAKPISDALNIRAPSVNIPTSVPRLDVLDKLTGAIDLGIFNQVDQLADALLRATSCRA